MNSNKSLLSSLLSLLLALAGPAALAAPAAGPAPQNAPAASGGPAGSKSRWKSDVFVITRDASGKTVCRAATSAERRNLLRPDRERPDRVLIYPGARRAVPEGADKSGGPRALTTESGQTLLPSAGLNIVLHGTTNLNNNIAARDAFIVAANRWEALISTQMTVVIDADFGPTFFGEPYSSPNVLGATGTAEITRRFSTARNQLLAASPQPAEATLYNALPATTIPVETNNGTGSTNSSRLAVPLARALGLEPDITNPDSIPLEFGDAGIGFNSAHTFDFNPGNGIAPNATDFDAVVVHEIGHALGFSSESGSSLGAPTMLDLYRFRPGAASAGNLATVATAPRVMTTGGTQVFFSNRLSTFGTNELGLSTGGPMGNLGDGEQSSHWKADEQSGIHIGIMDPTIADGVRETLTDNDRLAFDTFGYRLDGVMVSPPPAPAAQPPPNNDFANAIVISGASGSVTGDNFDATPQAGEPDPSQDPNTNATSSVWYRWTAPASGMVTMDTIGSDYDTSLGAYTGNSHNALTPAGPNSQNDDIDLGVNLISRITFTAAAGTTYQIMVTGWNGDTGTFRLNWSGPSAPPSSNPIDGTTFFVRQHYLDFLNREPDDAGLAFWSQGIESCGADAQCRQVKRVDTSAAFFLSIEFQETGYLVYRLYKAAYGDINPPAVPVPVRLGEFITDTQAIGQGVQVGVGDWAAQLEANKNAFAAAFAQRSRFTTALPTTLTSAQFVDQLNQNAGGALSQSERDQLVAELTSGAKTRAQVLRAVAEDQTLRAAEFRKAFVLMQYFGYLRRNPDSGQDTNFDGFNFWLTKLNDFNGDFRRAEMVRAFIESIEYRHRFGQ